MLSLDTNILLHSLWKESLYHLSASEYLDSLSHSRSVVISEFILIELFVLLCNPAILQKPLKSEIAAVKVDQFRQHPAWHIVSFPQGGQKLHDQLWNLVSRKNFAYRKIFDLRLALCLRQQGVREFATRNTKDFQTLGFENVFDPLTKN